MEEEEVSVTEELEVEVLITEELELEPELLVDRELLELEEVGWPLVLEELTVVIAEELEAEVVVVVVPFCGMSNMGRAKAEPARAARTRLIEACIVIGGRLVSLIFNWVERWSES